MSAQQISVFLENKPGMLEAVTETLTAEHIDMRALSLADSSDYGIMRMLVDDTDKAMECLAQHGYLVKVNTVIAVSIDDTPGGLAGVIKLLSQNGVNIEYLYVYVLKSNDTACAVFRVQDNQKVEQILTANGVKLLPEAGCCF